jgi:hypothetical protein
MKKVNLIISTLATLFVFCSTNSFSQDWPQWRGLNRDGKGT